jgi:glutamate synthase (NADPH/NADH) small chain
VLDGCQDDAVTIREIELSIIETAFQQGYIRPSPPARRLEERVAVVGSGPAGLAVADYLNRAGYPVTVYDKAEKPGGILRYGIPDFKMEKWVVDRRIELMKREGIDFEMGVQVGDDISFKYLSRRYAAIALCFGSREPRDLKVPGRDLEGVHFAMDFLIRQNKMNTGEAYDPDESLDAKGKSVVVIGGGDTGSDCVGTSVRQGARKLYQLEILPKPPERRPDDTPWPGWPNILRESSSHKEGGQRMWSIATKELIGEAGHVKRLKAVEVDWLKAPDGRWQMKERSGTEIELEAELVLLAMGFVGPRKNRLLDDLDIPLTARGAVEVDENHMTKVPAVFAAGDMALGQSLVVKAIADGRKTAQGIIRYLQGVGGAKPRP